MHSLALHASKQGKGAVGSILCAGDGVVVTAGKPQLPAHLVVACAHPCHHSQHMEPTTTSPSCKLLQSSGAETLPAAGADCRVRVSCLRQGLRCIASAQLPDFPYSLLCSPDGQIALAGCGDGSLVAISLVGGQQLWSIQASAAAVRTLHLGQGCLLAAGDDGCLQRLRWD